MRTQRVSPFTGEGAYHGSTKPRLHVSDHPVPESEATTVDRNLRENRRGFDPFRALFTNDVRLKSQLPVPTQDQIRDDGPTFCWTPIEQACAEAGPLTRSVIASMMEMLQRKKRYVYIDSKIQQFQINDRPVDSKIWHVDGGITVRDQRAQDLGYDILHDIRARVECVDQPLFLAYQSSHHCATQYAVGPLEIIIPECITSFDELDSIVRTCDPPVMSQPAASIISFDGLALHRAVPAQANEWRLWVRCIETDREVTVDPTIIECYNTVFRPGGIS